MVSWNRIGLVSSVLLVLPHLVAITASAQQVQSLRHDSNGGEFNSLIQIDADTYVLAYAGRARDGFIKTFTIPADGSAITQVQSLEHETDEARMNSLVQGDADTYVLAYADLIGDGFIKTFTIPADGSTITQVQVLEHDDTSGEFNSLVHVDGDTYALAYRGTDNDGFIKTFTIPADGSTITQVQVLEHDTVSGDHNSLVQVDADTYALAYSGQDDAGFMKTFTISADGSTITQVQSLEHDTDNASFNSLVQVDVDTFALAYAGPDSDGFLKTFTIPADGSTITQVQSLEHATNATFNSLSQVDADTFALAYSGGGFDGFVRTFAIPADGSTITQVQTLEHNTNNVSYNSLVQVDADTFALAYNNQANNGVIKTFMIDMNGGLPVTLMSFTVE